MKSTFKIVKEHGYRIIIDGHDTFAEDVVRKLERLDYLEKERLKLSDNSDYAKCPLCKGCGVMLKADESNDIDIYTDDLQRIAYPQTLSEIEKSGVTMFLNYLIVGVCLGLLIIVCNLIAIRVQRWMDDFSTIRQQPLSGSPTAPPKLPSFEEFEKYCTDTGIGKTNDKLFDYYNAMKKLGNFAQSQDVVRNYKTGVKNDS